MATIKTKNKTKKPSEEHIDAMIVAEAEVSSAWSKPVKVRRSKSASVSLPASLAARAAFAGLKGELVSGARKGR